MIFINELNVLAVFILKEDKNCFFLNNNFRENFNRLIFS